MVPLGGPRSSRALGDGSVVRPPPDCQHCFEVEVPPRVLDGLGSRALPPSAGGAPVKNGENQYRLHRRARTISFDGRSLSKLRPCCFVLFDPMAPTLSAARKRGMNGPHLAPPCLDPASHSPDNGYGSWGLFRCILVVTEKLLHEIRRPLTSKTGEP